MVSISLSILLVIIPLQSNAQEQPSARLFLIDGQVLQIEIVLIQEREVLYRKSNNRDGVLNVVPFEQVRKLVSTKGQIILNDGIFSLTYIETSLNSRANEVWTIFKLNGSSVMGVIPVGVRTDSLIYYDMDRVRKAMNIEFIREVSRIKSASVGKSVAVGALIGTAAFGFLGEQKCKDVEGICPVGLFMIFGLVVGSTIGLIKGLLNGKNRTINLSKLTLRQKINKLEAEFRF